MSKTKAAETLRNGEQKGRWVCARLTDLVPLVLAKLCGFFPQLCTCVTHSRLFISVGMVEPQGKPKYFIERLVVGFGWVWYWLVVVWFFFHLPLVHCVQPQKSSLCAPEVRVRGTGCDLPEPHTALRAPRGTIPDQLPLSVLAGWAQLPVGRVTMAFLAPSREPQPPPGEQPPAPHPFLLSSSNRRSAGSQRGGERMDEEVSQLFCFCCGVGGGFLGLFVRLFSVWQVNELG